MAYVNKTAIDAVESWVRQFKESSKKLTVKKTNKLSIEDALATFGVKENYMILNKIGTEPRDYLAGGQVVSWIDTIQMIYRSSAESRSALEVFLGTPFGWVDSKLNQRRKCIFKSIEDTDTDIIIITIEVK